MLKVDTYEYKIVFVAPSQVLYDNTKFVIENNQWDKDILLILARDDKARSLVKKALKEHSSILAIISRGGTFSLLEDIYKDRLVMIEDVNIDKTLLLLQYQQLSIENKVAISCVDSLLPDESLLEEAKEKNLIDFPKIIKLSDPGDPELMYDDVEREIEEFIQDGGNYIIADAFPAKIATDKGLKVIPVETTRSKIEVAIKSVLKQVNRVFVIMPFSDKHEYDDLYMFIKEAIEDAGMLSYRVDEGDSAQHITSYIEQEIRKSSLVVADLTNERPNCYYELGFARALNKKTIITAKSGSNIHFDVSSLPRIEYESNLRLKEELTKKIKQLQNV